MALYLAQFTLPQREKQSMCCCSVQAVLDVGDKFHVKLRCLTCPPSASTLSENQRKHEGHAPATDGDHRSQIIRGEFRFH